MKRNKIRVIVLAVFCISLISGAMLLFGPGCGSSTDSGDPQGTSADANYAPKINGASQKTLVGQIYQDAATGREWIYDGAQWVPHDDTVEAYYEALDKNKTMLAPTVYPTGACGTGTGAHAKHAVHAPDCKSCHMVGGAMCFDPSGPAVAPGQPVPSFDTSTKSCSNISCHGMYSGTYSFWQWLGDDNWELVTVNYAGSGGGTPNWYSTLGGCTACHGNPPTIPGSTEKYNWHGGYHGGGSDCQLCHPDATGSGGVGTAITDASLHANGVVNVQAQYKSSCFNCH